MKRAVVSLLSAALLFSGCASNQAVDDPVFRDLLRQQEQRREAEQADTRGPKRDDTTFDQLVLFGLIVAGALLLGEAWEEAFSDGGGGGDSSGPAPTCFLTNQSLCDAGAQ